jgi:hypothetical protein
MTTALASNKEKMAQRKRKKKLFWGGKNGCFVSRGSIVANPPFFLILNFDSDTVYARCSYRVGYRYL